MYFSLGPIYLIFILMLAKDTKLHSISVEYWDLVTSRVGSPVGKVKSGSSVKLLMVINTVQEMYKRTLCSNNMIFLTQYSTIY